MKCKNCGLEVNTGMSICPACGSPLYQEQAGYNDTYDSFADGTLTEDELDRFNMGIQSQADHNMASQGYKGGYIGGPQAGTPMNNQQAGYPYGNAGYQANRAFVNNQPYVQGQGGGGNGQNGYYQGNNGYMANQPAGSYPNYPNNGQQANYMPPNQYYTANNNQPTGSGFQYNPNQPVNKGVVEELFGEDDKKKNKKNKKAKKEKNASSEGGTPVALIIIIILLVIAVISVIGFRVVSSFANTAEEGCVVVPQVPGE